MTTTIVTHQVAGAATLFNLSDFDIYHFIADATALSNTTATGYTASSANYTI